MELGGVAGRTPMILAKQCEQKLCIIYSGGTARTSFDTNTFVSRRKLVFLSFFSPLPLLSLPLSHGSND